MECPRCGSEKVNKKPMGVTFFASGGCLMIIPVIGWIIGLLCWLMAIYYGIKPMYSCHECGKDFQ